ncbi:MAG: NADH:ubiquinone oxidoreductase subunit NDUFA12 [Caulobacterales bacterium]|nr:NADH:ubiquinone oxidoreductase subunit NDUFA12 [Caulobacterales bacterium]
MLRFIKRLFAWWEGSTLGTSWTLFQRARFVGDDEYGNRYFEERRTSLEGRKRRYVIYDGYADASRVPPDWHGWLHHTFEEPPTRAPLARQPWELDHQPNLTGTLHAYRPRGSLARGGERAPATGDYEAWTPGEG